jgi:serpin B
MQQVLGFAGLELGALNQAHKAVDTLLNEVQTNVIWKVGDTSQTNVILTTANAIWYRTGIVVKPTFIECNRKYFGTAVDALDFADPHSVDVMNAWAREKTHGRINGIADGLINRGTALFLANAIYFKEKWLMPFEVKNTKDRPFHLRNGQQTKIPMMERADRFTYRRGTGYQAVRLPYQAWNLAMYVFLPDVGSSPEKLLGILNGDTWQKVAKPGFEGRPGSVVLPRFKLQYGIELERPLIALGMKAAFGFPGADFSGMSEGLFVSVVRQRTFVEVNEEGTEATVVTGATMESGIEESPPKPFEMIVDHPFLFLIEDQKTEMILFMGLVFDPQQQ